MDDATNVSPGEIPSQTATEPACPLWKRLLIGKNPRHTFTRILVTTLALLLLFKYVLMPIKVAGMSMDPSYLDHKVYFANRLAYLFSEPQRGDVVVVEIPGQDRLLKRVVGLPGERVRYDRGRIWINGELLDEPYVRFKDSLGGSRRADQLEDGYYFIAGDNRRNTVFGPVRRAYIVGKVVF